MGGRSKSSTSTQNVENTVNTNEAISNLDDATVYSDIGGDISILDGGAVDSAFDFGKSSFNFAGEGLDSILDFGSEIVEGQNKQLTNSLSSINAANATQAQLESSNTQSTIKTVAKYAAMALVAWGALTVIKKVRK